MPASNLQEENVSGQAKQLDYSMHGSCQLLCACCILEIIEWFHTFVYGIHISTNAALVI